MFGNQPFQIVAIVAFAERLGLSCQQGIVNPALTMGYFFKATDLHALALLQGADKVAGVQKAVVRACISQA